MNRDKLWGALRTLAITLALSILTWVYAYRQLETTQEFRFALKIDEPRGSRLVVSTPPGSNNVLTIRVTGSQRLLDQLAETLSLNNNLLTYTLPPETQVGTKVLSTREIIRNLPQLPTARLLVDSIDKPDLQVEVDQLQTVEMPVNLDEAVLALRPAQPPVITPDRVKVTLPARLYQSLSNVQRRVLAVVSLDELKGSASSNVVEFNKSVPLAADFRDTTRSILIEPKTATVQIQLQLQSRPIEGPVAVQFMGPRELWDNYTVVLRDQRETRLNLNVFVLPGVKGPLNADKILAFVRLSSADATVSETDPTAWRDHEVEFVLPAGMRAAWETPSKVGLRLVPKGTKP